MILKSTEFNESEALALGLSFHLYLHKMSKYIYYFMFQCIDQSHITFTSVHHYDYYLLLPAALIHQDTELFSLFGPSTLWKPHSLRSSWKQMATHQE